MCKTSTPAVTLHRSTSGSGMALTLNPALGICLPITSFLVAPLCPSAGVCQRLHRHLHPPLGPSRPGRQQDEASGHRQPHADLPGRPLCARRCVAGAPAEGASLGCLLRMHACTGYLVQVFCAASCLSIYTKEHLTGPPAAGSRRIVSTSFDCTLRIWDGCRGLAPLLSIPHDNRTGRWVLPFRAVWNAAGDGVVVGACCAVLRRVYCAYMLGPRAGAGYVHRLFCHGSRRPVPK
jgi:hypothetical protein